MLMLRSGQLSLRIDQPAPSKPHSAVRAGRWGYFAAKRDLDLLGAVALGVLATPLALVYLVRRARGRVRFVQTARVGLQYTTFFEYTFDTAEKREGGTKGLTLHSWPMLW